MENEQPAVNNHVNNDEMDEKLPTIPIPPSEKSNGRVFLESLLNKTVKIEITDGRTLIGTYLCTDREKNIILGSCQEFIANPETSLEEPRLLGLAMIPGRHVKSLHADIDNEFHLALKDILKPSVKD